MPPSPDSSSTPRRRSSALKSRILQAERAAFERAAVAFETDAALERAASVIAGSRRRFVLGRGASHGLATALATALSASFSQVTLAAPPALEALDLLADVRGGDSLIALCTRPYRRDVVEISRQYVAAGGTLIIVTDSADSPLSAFAAEQVIVDTEDRELGDTSAGIVLALRLLADLAAASSKGATRRAQERDRLGEALDLYVPAQRWDGRAPDPRLGGSVV
ncbi:SIS domain-containing protein [Leucobacter chromiireducens]|uniref:SIS domain-containing protein n=1 Tax=Leucobacter chromiireducens subsp. chromiireducens TaxID=660067 RepID=A0ABS1SQP5_9MICO|nr:SIS domain-containing protein [Leucobacter chromiireducens]MBL3689839.1 SIS domain-containing protein [Leucobacter chromiireducens subsp. chromiireducens]